MSDDFPDLLASQQDQLVVDRPHGELVVHFLTKHVGLASAEVKEVDFDLDLALLDLSGVELCAAAITAARPEPIARLRNELPSGALEPLDIVVFELRAKLAEALNGFVPGLGKNRTVAGIVTWPGSKGAATGPEVPDGEASWQQVVDEAHPGGTVDPEAGRGVRVGILDTKLFAHPNLAGAFLAPADGQLQFLSGIPFAGEGHATFVSGLVHAQAPAADLVINWFLNENQLSALTWDTAKKLAWFIGRGLDVVNLSFGSRTADGKPPFALSRAIERLSADTLVVASAGNHGDSGHPKDVMWPAALPGVISVGAVDHNGVRAPFSPNLPWIHSTAPGVELLSTYLFGHVKLPSEEPETKEFFGFARGSGTSFAAATVTGKIAAATVPGSVSAKGALDRLLDDPDSKVTKYEWEEEPPHPG